MHEISIIDGIVRIVEAHQKKYNFKKVTEIEILCGKYNCLSEESLQFCMDVAVDKPCLRGTRLRVKRIAAEDSDKPDNGIYINKLEVQK